MNKFRFFVAVASVFAIALTFLGVSYVSNAQSLKADRDDKGEKNPVVVKGDRFCGSESDPSKIAAMEDDFSSRLTNARQGGGGSANVTGGVINVYFHVIKKRNGNCPTAIFRLR